MGNSAFKAHNFTVSAVTTSKTDKVKNTNQVYIPSYHGNFDKNKVGNKGTDFQYPIARNATGEEIGSGVMVWVLFEGGDVRCPIVISSTNTTVQPSDFPGLKIDNAGIGAGSDVTGNSSDAALLANNSLYGLARQLLLSHESGASSYAAMLSNDNGALSVGLIGFHGTNAQTLLQKIKEKYPTDWEANGGNNVSNVYGGDWNHKILTDGSAEYNSIKAIISSTGGKKVQDEMVDEYLAQYMNQARSAGVTEGPALVFYCDMAVQAPYGALSVAQNATNKDLDGLYNEVMKKDYWLTSYTANRNRRKDSYDTIKKWIKEGKFKSDPYGISDETKPFIWPVPYSGSWISSPYGDRNMPGTNPFHEGIDICTPGADNNDKVVISTGSGTVHTAVNDCNDNYGKQDYWNYRSQQYHGGCGNYVIIKHDENNMVSMYLHLASVSVKSGERVQAGQIIGILGSTGCSTGHHLHFQIMKNGDTVIHQTNSVNPEDYVGKKK